MPCDLTTIQSSACTSGIGKLTDSVGLLQVIAQLLCDVSSGGGGGGSEQIKIYVTDPNAEGVLPEDVTKGAIAYSLDPNLSTMTWNTSTLLWQ